MEENIIKGYLGYKGEPGLSAYEIAVAHGYTGTELEWVHSLGSASSYTQYSTKYTGDGTTTDFALSSLYDEEHFFVDVYVDGLHKMCDVTESGTTITKDYQIIKDGDVYKISFHTAPSNSSVIDVVATQVTATDLPISDTLSAESTNETASGSKAVYDKITEVSTSIPSLNSIIDMIYPVGSIYMSVNSTSPGVLFGGTWEQIQDRFLLASGSTYTAGNMDGEASHKLTINEMPSHYHGHQNANGYYLGCADGTVSRVGIQTNSSSNRYTFVTNSNMSNTVLSFNDATKNSGGNGYHNNMPPYLVVNVWKRTA